MPDVTLMHLLTRVNNSLRVLTDLWRNKEIEPQNKLEKYGSKKDVPMVWKTIHRQENNDLLLQSSVLQSWLQRTYPGT